MMTVFKEDVPGGALKDNSKFQRLKLGKAMFCNKK